MIYKAVFSPTGGCLKIGDILTSIYDTSTTIDLTNPDMQDYELNKEDLIYVIAPVYGGVAPQVCIDRLMHIKGNQARCVVVAVYGLRAYDNTLVQLEDACTKIGLKVIAGISAIAKHSLTPSIGSNRPNKEDEEMLIEFSKKIQLKQDDTTPTFPGTRPYKSYTKGGNIPYKGDDCINCLLCKKQCVMQAIDNNAITNPDLCISCMRCVYICVKHTRTIGEEKVNMITEKLKPICDESKKNELFI